MYNIDVPTFSIMPNSRISDLFQVKNLDQDLDAEALLLIARAKSHNKRTDAALKAWVCMTLGEPKENTNGK